jgi:hypothetical protein
MGYAYPPWPPFLMTGPPMEALGMPFAPPGEGAPPGYRPAFAYGPAFGGPPSYGFMPGGPPPYGMPPPAYYFAQPPPGPGFEVFPGGWAPYPGAPPPGPFYPYLMQGPGPGGLMAPEPSQPALRRTHSGAHEAALAYAASSRAAAEASSAAASRQAVAGPGCAPPPAFLLAPGGAAAEPLMPGRYVWQAPGGAHRRAAGLREGAEEGSGACEGPLRGGVAAAASAPEPSVCSRGQMARSLAAGPESACVSPRCGSVAARSLAADAEGGDEACVEHYFAAVSRERLTRPWRVAARKHTRRALPAPALRRVP